MTINVVVISYGYAGKNFHCYLVKQTKDLKLYGVYARNPDTRAKIKQGTKISFGCFSKYFITIIEEQGEDVKVFDNYDDVLSDSQVQLVIIATPPDSHYDYSIQAMKKGKNVVAGNALAPSHIFHSLLR